MDILIYLPGEYNEAVIGTNNSVFSGVYSNLLRIILDSSYLAFAIRN